jgi:DNA-binding GntR family transcriptional regulator
VDEICSSVDLASFFRSREKLGEGVYKALQYLITTQRIQGGERLDYKKIGALLNVSRVPIREAIQRL